MSTLRISNIEAKADNSSPTVDEQLKFTNSTGDVLLHLDGRTSGITTVGINTTAETIKFDSNNNIMVTGIVTATEFHGTLAVGTSVTYGDNEKAYFGNGLDLQIFHNNSDSVISQSAAGTGNLKILSGGAQSIECVKAGAVNIAHNGTTKLATTSTGAQIDTILILYGAAGNPGRLRLQEGGAISEIIGTRNSDANSDLQFKTERGDGTQVRAKIDYSGHFIPGADSTYDLGLTGTRWRNLYADTLYGDGSNLTGMATQTTINNNTNNYLITGTGTANTLQGESGLTWDGATLSATGSDAQLRLYDSTASSENSALRIMAYNGVNFIQSGKAFSSDSKADLIFGSMFGGTEWVRITSTGRLGLGTNNPSCELHVSGANPRSRFTSTGNTVNYDIFMGSSNATVGTQSNHDLLFMTNDNERARIDSDGNFMIGRNAGQKKLSVRTTSTSSGVHIVQTIGGANHASGYAVGLGFDPEGYEARNKIAIVAEGTGSGYSRGKLHFLLDSANDSGEATVSESRMTITDGGLVGINESSPSTALDIKGSGVPMVVNSSNSNTFKIQLEDNGTVKGYLGCDGTNLLNLGNSSAASKFRVNTAGVTYNVDGSTHGSGVYMCEVHTDLLKLLKSSQNHPNTTGNYYSWSDGGTASWSWDNGVLRMDSNVGSHSWQCGSVYLTAGYYTLMQCWRACSDAHGWSNFGSSSNGNAYYLTDDAAYGSYNTLLTSYSGQHSRSDGKSRWFSTTTGNLWHYVSSAGTYRIQQMGQPYGSGGYKYYILAAYLLKLK